MFCVRTYLHTIGNWAGVAAHNAKVLPMSISSYIPYFPKGHLGQLARQLSSTTFSPPPTCKEYYIQGEIHSFLFLIPIFSFLSVFIGFVINLLLLNLSVLVEQCMRKYGPFLFQADKKDTAPPCPLLTVFIQLRKSWLTKLPEIWEERTEFRVNNAIGGTLKKMHSRQLSAALFRLESGRIIILLSMDQLLRVVIALCI